MSTFRKSLTHARVCYPITIMYDVHFDVIIFGEQFLLNFYYYLFLVYTWKLTNTTKGLYLPEHKVML